MSEPASECQRVLLVDDDPLVLTALARLLESWGHEVRSAADGAEAVEIAKEFQPEAVLCDLGLPKHHGYEVAELINQVCRPQPLMVAMSGYRPEAMRPERSGFALFVAKPAVEDDLLPIFGRVC